MSEKTTTDRRSFLKWAGLGSAGAVAASAGVQTANAENVSAEGYKGYSESDHVKKVYELSRF